MRAVIALTLFASVMLIGLLGAELNDNVLERVREQRLESVTGELRARLQTDLRIGLSLAGDPRAQAMLEEVVTRSPLLVESIEVDSDHGTVLFDSDRALRGQSVPRGWLDAARAHPEGWRVIRRDEHTLGTPLRDAFGDTVGYLVSTHIAARDSRLTRSVLMRVLWIAACTAVLAILAGGLGQQIARSRRLAELSRLEAMAPDASRGALEEAGRALADARDALARMDRDAQRIAGIDT